tara:strand:+ start:3412 stop:3531 length:120 start_codon:yes stop_codon:yes gene_type:complete
LNISPKEAYELPANIVMELLYTHQEVEMLKAKEMEKMTR